MMTLSDSEDILYSAVDGSVLGEWSTLFPNPESLLLSDFLNDNDKDEETCRNDLKRTQKVIQVSVTDEEPLEYANGASMLFEGTLRPRFDRLCGDRKKIFFDDGPEVCMSMYNLFGRSTAEVVDDLMSPDSSPPSSTGSTPHISSERTLCGNRSPSNSNIPPGTPVGAAPDTSPPIISSPIAVLPDVALPDVPHPAAASEGNNGIEAIEEPLSQVDTPLLAAFRKLSHHTGPTGQKSHTSPAISATDVPMQEMHVERESNSGPVRSRKSHVEKRTRASSSPRTLSSPRLQAAAILPIPAELVHGTGSDKVMLPSVCKPNPAAKGASFAVRMPDKPAPAAAPLPNLSSSKKKTVAKKLHPCEYDGCPKTFTRRGDVRRHMETASEHKPDVPRGADSATRCRHCNDELSRPDARRRHEERGACGKRTIPRSKAYLESNKLLTLTDFRHAE